ncbi:hypothetical protein M409DRAFT_50326 [Zasmidium cellare ATCC 36951]|uniref:Extracellular mutant protein 11 C-terminal domain-containing protein n=1 Tax=Zasmidium cellare ATCC 36951 TaxID=1080233 RepID=A0A6A6CWS4_ZASCE|nr:uncharacterized protein M409DRAFT_50326 [Zasmidium cellare ATCC 36951]KAF2171657.1 hypothetical protein M409DRAFT_50326 [Zasmidium cellare ATCC 36951]
MAARTRGMADHVKKQNPQQHPHEVKTQHSKEEVKKSLKYDPKALKNEAPANTTAIRDQKHDLDHKGSYEQDELNGRPDLYGTNYSSTEVSNMSGQTRRDPQETQEEESVDGFHEDVGSEGSDADGPADGDDDSEEILREAHLQNSQIQPLNTARRTGNFPHTEGDTYPTSTLDPTTPSDANASHQNNDTGQAHTGYYAPQPAPQIPTRSRGTRLALPNNEQPPHGWQQQHQPPQQMQQQPQQLDDVPQAVRGGLTTNADTLISEISSSFNYARMRPLAPRDQHNAARAQPQSGPAPNSMQPNNPGSISAIRDAPTRGPDPANALDGQPRHVPEIHRSNTPQLQSKPANAKTVHRRKSGNALPAAQTGYIEQQQGGKQQVVAANRGRPQIRQEPVRHEEPAPQSTLDLDYVEPELYDKTYEELKEASFDSDPMAVEFRFHENEARKDLPQKLHYVGGLSHKDQVRFFESLNIETWEEAGEWFLQRFGDLTEKLKENRREKRKEIEVFEDEIRDRHNTVAKKQKMTTDALKEMKESGGKVLQGTPRKIRKSK